MSSATQFPWDEPGNRDSYDPKYIDFVLNDFLPKQEIEIANHRAEIDRITHPALKIRKKSELMNDIRDSYYLPVDSFKDDVIVTEETLTGIDGFEIPIRVYKPRDSKIPNGVYINFHGGGWVLGDLDLDRMQSYWLVHLSGVTVIDVGYRMIPEWAYSTCYYDAYGAIRYVYENHERFGIDPKKISIGGTSAGAKLSLASAHMCRDLKIPIGLVIAIVPPVQKFLETSNPEDFEFSRSLIKFGNDPFVGFGGIVYFEKLKNEAEVTAQRIDRDLIFKTFGDSPDYELYQGSIIEASSYKDLSKHIIIVGENDVLVDGGKAYAKKLVDTNTEVTFITARGLGHLFSSHTGIFSQSKRILFTLGKELERLQAGDYSA